MHWSILQEKLGKEKKNNIRIIYEVMYNITKLTNLLAHDICNAEGNFVQRTQASPSVVVVPQLVR